jgi:hypothetical protein
MVRRVEPSAANPPAFPPAATVLSAAVLASQRVLPVADPLAPLLPDGGLVRGQPVATRGIAAMSLALGLVTAATAAGSWLAVVGVPTLGLEAAEELGIPLERVVRVDPGERSNGAVWAELMAAVVDGFEVVITRVPASVPAGLAHKMQRRLQARDAVMVALGPPGPIVPAVELHATHPRWDGVDAGAGYLRGRRVTVTATGRRVPRPRRAELWLPGRDGKVAAVTDAVAVAAAPREAADVYGSDAALAG